VSTPDARPEVFVDISLGAKAVPAVFREAGYTVHTTHLVFGQRRKVADTEWIELADAERWLVACKDARIRRRPAEKLALARSTLRVLCLTNGNLPSVEQARRFQLSMRAFTALWSMPGPCVYGVYRDRIERLKIYDPRSAP
jgi:predicted nuclease of predicted toxin-antitoxin system